MAAWRARRAARRSAPTLVVGAGSQVRLEAGPLGTYVAAAGSGDCDPRATFGTDLIRDSYGPRAFATLVRYRGSVLAELFRSLAALKLLQAEARQPSAPGRRGRRLPLAMTQRTRESPAEQGVGMPDPG